jgi:predicted permease
MRAPLNGLTRTWRALWRPRGFLPLAALTLGIGLAAFAGALTMVDSLLSAPPFPDHDRIVIYGETGRDPVGLAVSPNAYDAIGRPPGVLSNGAAHVAESVNVRVGARQTFGRAQRVDAGFLPTLGVGSVLPEDSSVAADRGVMLSYAFWQGWLAGDAGVVGRSIAVNGTVMMVRGVLPPDYRMFADIDLLLPLPSMRLSSDDAANLVAVARLAPGVSGDSVARWLHVRLPNLSYGTMPLDVVLTSEARPIVLIFFMCSFLVLVVAGVNLSNLLLSRALRRTHETCLSIAFGGLGWRPMLPQIADVAAISTGGLIVGLPLAHVIVMATRPFVPASWLISSLPIDLHWTVYLATVLAAVFVTTVAAIPGAMHASPARILRAQFSLGQTSHAGPARRARRLMVLIQTAVATMLLVLGVATVTRWWCVMKVPLGFQATGASFVEINPDTLQFPTLDGVVRVSNAVRLAALRLPGVEAAGLTTLLPVGTGFFIPFRSAGGGTSYLRYVMVSPGAMDAMGVGLVAGRDFSVDDRESAPAVAMVNQAYLDRIDRRGIGASVRPASRLAANRPLRIVGVVTDTRVAGAERAAEPTVFVPFAQVDAGAYAFVRRFVPTFVVVRGPGSTLMEAQALQRTVEQAAPGLVAGPLRPLRQVASEATVETRRNAALAATFAGMALSLAYIGLYAVHALDMISRQRDIALRDALGATPLDLLGYTFARGMAMATPGVALGLAASIVLKRGFRYSLLDTGSVDAGVAAAVALLMIFAALCAVALPSLRASAVRSVTILRGELTTSPRWPRRHRSLRS